MEAHIKCWEHQVANPRHSYFLHGACHSLAVSADWMANLRQCPKCRAPGLGGSEERTNTVLLWTLPAPQCSQLPAHLTTFSPPNTEASRDSSQNSTCSTELFPSHKESSSMKSTKMKI